MTDERKPVVGYGPDDADVLRMMWSFQQGDVSAFDELSLAMWDRICGKAKARGRRWGKTLGEDEAEDTAQKVLTKIYVHAAKATFEHAGQVFAWIFVITKREVDRYLRKRSPQLTEQEVLERELDCGDVHPAESLANSEALEHLGDCIGQLKDADREFLQDHSVKGMTFRQAAAVNGVSLGQFKHRHEKALQQVRDCMKSKGHLF